MRVFEVREQFGNCLELVSMDPNFHNITVGLFIKNDILTVWSYSKKEGVKLRLNTIRDKMVELGGLKSINEDFKLKVPKGYFIERPLRFLFTQSVEKGPDFKFDTGPISASDNKTKLLFNPENKKIISAGIVGTNAGDLICETTLAIEMGADVDDIALSIHPHPTLSETVANAAEMFSGTITDLYATK